MPELGVRSQVTGKYKQQTINDKPAENGRPGVQVFAHSSALYSQVRFIASTRHRHYSTTNLFARSPALFSQVRELGGRC